MLDDLIMAELNITRSWNMCLFVFFSGKSKFCKYELEVGRVRQPMLIIIA